MFIWNFVLEKVLDDMLDWIYKQIVGFLANFFSAMGNMGVEMFQFSWVQSIVLFFSYLAWALYVVGLVVAVFETAIEYQNGRGSIKELALNAIKGFMAVSLFTIVPVRLYELSVNLQSTLTAGLTGGGRSIGNIANSLITGIGSAPNIMEAGNALVFGGLGSMGNPIMTLFITIMMGYAVIKVFFANLKRGGILLIQIAVGSLYMFSVPRGIKDGFTQWCKQIVALCLTAFLQVTILTAGLLMIKNNALLGLGLMLSAGEVPRIAGAFGLDTSTKANVVGAVQTTSMAVSTAKNIATVVPK